MNNLLAQVLQLPTSNPAEPTARIVGPLGTTTLLGRPISSIGDFVTALLLIVFPLAAGMALVYIVIASFQIMFSQGNSDTVAKAKGKITTAVIGVVVISLAWFITFVVDKFFLATSGFIQ